MSEIGFDGAYQILNVFRDRKGFDEWWDCIDHNTQEEILNELAKVKP